MRKSIGRSKWLLAIVVLAFFLRLYRINNPISDWHAFRQADTASVTREFVKHGIDLLRPTYHDHSNIQSGKDNPAGYRMVEFPIVNGVTALLLRAAPGLPLVLTSRLLSVFASLGTVIMLYLLVKQISNTRLAAVTALVFSVLPFSVYYSRAILPEPYMVFLSVSSLATFVIWIKNQKWPWYAVSVVTLSLALLLKPFVLFLAPVYLVLVFQQWRWKSFKQWSLIPYVVLAVTPLWWWRQWILQFPEGIPASDWLLNGNGIRLRPAWFRWLFWERLTILMLGYVGAVVLPFNLLKRSRDIWVYGAWWLGILAYFVVVASGNVQHDYYQNLALPIVCISLARGLLVMYDYLKRQLNQTLAFVSCSLLLALSVLLAWQRMSGYFNVNHWEYVKAGEAADKTLPPDALVIAPAFGDTQFLFQTNRTGWPIGFEIPLKIEKGAQYYVGTSDDDEARELLSQYQVIERGDGYFIIDLQQPVTASAAAIQQSE